MDALLRRITVPCSSRFLVAMHVSMVFSTAMAFSHNGETVPVPSRAPGAPPPPCNMVDLYPCINGAIESYVRATQGDDANMALIDPKVTQTVATAMAVGLENPQADLNATCDIWGNIDTVSMVKCLKDSSKECIILPPATFQVDPDDLPALSGFTIADSARLAPYLCNNECANFPMAEKIDKITECWMMHRDTIKGFHQHAETDHKPSESHCADLADFIECHWNNSLGCPFTEKTSKDYFATLDDTLKACVIVNPAIGEVTSVTNTCNVLGTGFATLAMTAVAAIFLIQEDIHTLYTLHH